MYPKSFSNISLVDIGEAKYFDIVSKAIDGGCLPDAYWDFVPYFSTRNTALIEVHIIMCFSLIRKCHCLMTVELILMNRCHWYNEIIECVGEVLFTMVYTLIHKTKQVKLKKIRKP